MEQRMQALKTKCRVLDSQLMTKQEDNGKLARQLGAIKIKNSVLIEQLEDAKKKLNKKLQIVECLETDNYKLIISLIKMLTIFKEDHPGVIDSYYKHLVSLKFKF